jgi:hypothetical protein
MNSTANLNELPKNRWTFVDWLGAWFTRTRQWYPSRMRNTDREWWHFDFRNYRLRCLSHREKVYRKKMKRLWATLPGNRWHIRMIP